MLSEKEYKNIIKNMPLCTVDLVIYHNKKVLLIFRKDEPAKDQWWTVGGRIYKNEKLAHAVIRKAYEEVGLNVEIEREIGHYELFFDKSNFDDVKSHFITLAFLVKPIKGDFKIKVDKPSYSYKWIDRIDDSLHPWIKKVLNDSGIFGKKR